MWLERYEGFRREFLQCSYGHDHAVLPVVGLMAERAPGYGKERRVKVHCPSCGMADNSRVRSERRDYPNLESAELLGHVLPCGFCFKALDEFLSRVIERRS